MPWTVEDVEKHNKGLTDKQKSQWVAVANSALKKCMDDGGTEETCAVSAIKQANGVLVNEDMGVYNTPATEYEIRSAKLHKRKHIVVPVVMMVEGVHSGNHGAVYHSANELQKFVDSWNGIPVVIDHPKKDGVHVSANQPDILEESVGKVFKTTFDNGKLKAEVWLDEEQLKEISPMAMAYIKEMKPLDVSVGVFTDQELFDGQWNEEKYNTVARNYRPDHLALLPGGRGACSWNDGCGIRVNSNNDNKKGGNAMSDVKISPCCLAKIEQLISNKHTRFTDDDKEWLLLQEESQLDKLFPVETTQEPVQVNKDQVAEFFKPASKLEDFTVYMPDALKVQVNTGMEMVKKQREEVIADILANSGEVWKQEELEGMNSEMLEKISKTLKPIANYSAQGAGAAGGNSPKIKPLRAAGN